jgi:rubredoxin-NAD+ reductase
MKAADKMAVELNATVRAGVSVERIDTAGQQITLVGGEVLAYRDVVLALGADPMRLPLAGDGADAVMSVNDLDDYARFAQALDGARSVAILGGGLIGCEFANDLLHRGIQPSVIDMAEWPLSRLLPRERVDHGDAGLGGDVLLAVHDDGRADVGGARGRGPPRDLRVDGAELGGDLVESVGAAGGVNTRPPSWRLVQQNVA